MVLRSDRHGEWAETQRRYFEKADAARFHWLTRDVAFADTEEELLAPLLHLIEEPCLEIGCGEGTNLVRFTRSAPWVGVDLFLSKIAFAKRHVPNARFAAADANTLPFREAQFRTVLLRDVLHHVAAPVQVLSEAVRVLAPKGRLILIEGNARNPLVNLQTRIVPAEAAGRKFDPEHVAGLLGTQALVSVELTTSNPIPLRRTLFHYRYGLPAVGRCRLAKNAVIALEHVLAQLIDPSRWEHVVATAQKPAEGARS